LSHPIEVPAKIFNELLVKGIPEGIMTLVTFGAKVP